MTARTRRDRQELPAAWAGLPIRTCLGCGRKRPRAELVRLVLDAQGQAVVDERQAAHGRGGYLCGPGCLKAALKRQALKRAFRGNWKGVEADRLEAALGRAAERTEMS